MKLLTFAYQAALYFAMGKYERVLTVVKNAAARNIFEAYLEILAKELANDMKSEKIYLPYPGILLN